MPGAAFVAVSQSAGQQHSSTRAGRKASERQWLVRIMKTAKATGTSTRIVPIVKSQISCRVFLSISGRPTKRRPRLRDQRPSNMRHCILRWLLGQRVFQRHCWQQRQQRHLQTIVERLYYGRVTWLSGGGQHFCRFNQIRQPNGAGIGTRQSGTVRTH